MIMRLPPRWRRLGIGLVAGFAVYSMVGFLLLPRIIQWQLHRQLPAATHRQAAVRQVRCNPWTLSLTVRGFELKEPDGQPFASWEELYVNFQASSLPRWAWTFKEIRWVKPFGEVILLPDGRFNFSNLIPPPDPSPEPARIPRIRVFDLQVTNGFVAFEDRSRRSLFRIEHRPVNFRATQLTTLPNRDAPYTFHAEGDAGQRIAWTGNLAIQPLRSAGRFEIGSAPLARFQPFIEHLTRARVTNGLAGIQLDYRFEAGTNGVDLLVTNGLLRLDWIEVRDPDTDEKIAGLEGLTVQDASLDYRKRAARIGAVQIAQASVTARRKPDGRWNFLNLLEPPQPATPAAGSNAPPDAPSWTLAVDDLTLEKGAARFEDLTLRTPFRTVLEPIGATLKGFTTRAGAQAAFSVRAASEAAERLEAGGVLSIRPVRSSGQIQIADADLKKYMPYAERFLAGSISSGKLAVNAPYRVALGSDAPQAGVSNLTLRLEGLELKSPDGKETVVRIAEFGIERIEAALEDRRARAGLVRTRGGSVILRRAPDGRINLRDLLAVSSNAPPASAAASNAPPLGGWTASADEIALDQWAVEAEDHRPPKPASFLLDRIALQVRNASTAGDAPVGANLSLRINETASIGARGSGTISPMSADIECGVTNLDLRAAQPYIDPILRISIGSGSVNSGGRIRFQPKDPAAPRFTFTGGLRLTNFLAADPVSSNALASCEDLSASGLEAAFEPNRLTIEEVRMVAPKARAWIGSDLRLNFEAIRPAREAASSASPMPAAIAPAPERFAFRLGKLALERGAFDFVDESVEPHPQIGVQEVSGTIEGLSSAPEAIATVNLAGKVDEHSPFAVTGKANPFGHERIVDLVFSNANTQLTPLTGYLEKYVGHPLTKGRLTTMVHYRIQGEQLQAENKIQLDQLTLGPRNQSPDATSLPVKLGLALLKDSDGRIDLDLPLTGRLDDPQFRVGPLVLKAVVNILVKAAASPFKLLGALVGSKDDLSFIVFDPGSAQAPQAELDKIGKLVDALVKRPALSLEIEGAIDPQADRDALARRKLAEEIKARRLQELAARGRTPPSAEPFAVEPADYDRLLTALLFEKFGTNVAAVLATNPIVQAPRPPDPAAGDHGTNAPAPGIASRPGDRPSAQPALRRSWVRRTLGKLGLASRSDSPRRKLPPAARKMSKTDAAAIGQLTPETMETLIASTIEVGPQELRGLLDARARWVQEQLLQSGKIQADRLFLVSPRTAEAGHQGESRVNLTLN